MSDDLDFVNVYSALISAIPEIYPLMARELGKYYDLPNEIPDQYPIFEDVVKPYLRECLEEKSRNQIAVRIFQFLERMANSSDPNIVTLLRVGILESLVYDTAFYELAMTYMGPRTAEYAELDRQDYERRKTPSTHIN